MAADATVVVFGPNLSSRAQRKGGLHVHAVTCDDCKKYGPGKPMGGEDKGLPLAALTRRDVVLDIYADHGATVDTWEDYDDLYVAPCVTFADVAVDEIVTELEQDVEKQAAATVAAQIKEARDGLRKQLREHEVLARRLDKEVHKADAALAKVRGGDHDPITDKEHAAWKKVRNAHDAFINTHAAITRVKTALRKLDDQNDIDRRVADLVRQTRRNHTGGNKMATGNSKTRTSRRSTGSTRTTKTEMPQATIDRIVELIEEGNGVTAVAKMLADEKAPGAPSSGWYARAVYNAYGKATGKTVGSVRKGKSALKSRAVKDRPAAATKKLAKATTKRSSAKSKSTAKKTTAAAKRSPAKKTTAATKKTTAVKTTPAAAKPNGNGNGASKPEPVQVTPHPKPSQRAARAKTGATKSSSRKR